MFVDKKNIMWVLLSGVMVLIFVVMLFLLDIGMGGGFVFIYFVMFWCGFFGVVFWCYRVISGWVGFVYGSVVGLVI